MASTESTLQSTIHTIVTSFSYTVCWSVGVNNNILDYYTNRILSPHLVRVDCFVVPNLNEGALTHSIMLLHGTNFRRYFTIEFVVEASKSLPQGFVRHRISKYPSGACATLTIGAIHVLRAGCITYHIPLILADGSYSPTARDCERSIFLLNLNVLSSSLLYGE